MAGALGLCGCASVSEQTHAYLGSPRFAPTQPPTIQILAAEPPQPKELLGEVTLCVRGNPSRDEVEKKLKEAAAKLGANAVYVAYDKTHVLPIVYYDWWGPWVAESPYRRIVAVAIKYK